MNDVLVDLGLGTLHLENEQDLVEPLARRYGPPGGLMPLRSALAELQGVESCNILITTGGSLGLTAALACLERPGNVLLPRPFYPSYPGLLRCLALEPRTYPVDPGGPLDLAAVAAQIDGETRAVLVNTPGNPLGNILAARDLESLLALAARHDLLILVDEVYGSFVYEPAAGDWQGHGIAPGLVRILSFSKDLQLPGERIGYLVAPADWVAQIEEAHWLLAMSPPLAGQLRVAQALAKRDPTFFPGLLARLRRNRDLLCQRLAACHRLQVRRPRGGIFLWLEMKAGEATTSDQLAHLCELGGLRVTSGARFGVGSPAAIRCSFAVPEGMLEEAAERLRRIFDEPDGSGLAGR